MQAKELGDFLRSRRNRISPADVNLPGSARRRTPGLRREEVAQLAGVSITWYTWLEQGRVASTSRQVLASLARALRMNDAETAHLLSLGEPATGGVAGGARPAAREQVSEHLGALVKALDPNPAYVVDHRWDLLAWNRAQCLLFTDFARLAPEQRNIIWVMFCRPEMRARLRHWEDDARMLLGQFRAGFAKSSGDERFTEIADAVRAHSPQARLWWEQHEIHPFKPKFKVFDHPAGTLRLRYSKLAAMDTPNQHLVAYVPLDDETRSRISGTLTDRWAMRAGEAA